MSLINWTENLSTQVLYSIWLTTENTQLYIISWIKNNNDCCINLILLLIFYDLIDMSFNLLLRGCSEIREKICINIEIKPNKSNRNL